MLDLWNVLNIKEFSGKLWSTVCFQKTFNPPPSPIFSGKCFAFLETFLRGGGPKGRGPNFLNLSPPQSDTSRHAPVQTIPWMDNKCNLLLNELLIRYRFRQIHLFINHNGNLYLCKYISHIHTNNTYAHRLINFNLIYFSLTVEELLSTVRTKLARICKVLSTMYARLHFIKTPPLPGNSHNYLKI
jgi:hypothetical protein